MDDLFFFDANCRFGRRMNGGSPVVETPQQLVETMDRFGVDRALVRHMDIGNRSTPKSNADVAAFIDADVSGRLDGVWCILPEQCPEIPEPEQLAAEMKKHRIKALTLSPFAHHYLPVKIVIGKYMEMAKKHRIPVLLDAFAGKFDEVYKFVENFPENLLIYVETGGKWGTDRYIRPLLENYPDFHFELAGYWMPDGVRELVDLYGSKRIIFGSNYPDYIPTGEMLMLKHSGIPQNALADICGGNLKRLTEEII